VTVLTAAAENMPSFDVTEEEKEYKGPSNDRKALLAHRRHVQELQNKAEQDKCEPTPPFLLACFSEWRMSGNSMTVSECKTISGSVCLLQIGIPFSLIGTY
jgi:hypothetical protein